MHIFLTLSSENFSATLWEDVCTEGLHTRICNPKSIYTWIESLGAGDEEESKWSKKNELAQLCLL